MHWQIELPMIDVATVKTKCWPTVENIRVCDRCCVTQSQDTKGLILFVVVHCVREPTCMQQGVLPQKAKTLVAVYLSLISGIFISTTSHICSSLYLPIFLFTNGALTLMRMASLGDLAMFWSFLPTMLKLSVVMTSVVVMVMDRWGDLNVFF